MTYLEHVEIKPHEWKRIYAETAPQAKKDRNQRNPKPQQEKRP